jgi:hypothetical protein
MTSAIAPASRPRLSISFHGFWRDFRADDSFFVKALGQKYEVVVEEAGRDIQIASVFRSPFLPTVPGVRPLRVWWTGEAMDPKGQVFDLHFGFAPRTILGPERWARLPYWVTVIDWWNAGTPYSIDRLLAPRKFAPRPRFCNFIFRNTPSIRTEFFLRLDELRPVDSVGEVLNNRGWRAQGRKGKLAVLGESTFTVAFENEIAPGYVTEKLVEPLLAGSIPIYWGSPVARTDFNPAAFIFADDFPDLDALARHVVALAGDPARLAELATAPPFQGNRVAPELTPDFFLDRIDAALASDLRGRIPDRWSAHGHFAGRRRHPAVLLFKHLNNRVKNLFRPRRRASSWRSSGQ